MLLSLFNKFVEMKKRQPLPGMKRLFCLFLGWESYPGDRYRREEKKTFEKLCFMSKWLYLKSQGKSILL